MKKIPVFRVAVFLVIFIALFLPTQYLLQFRERQFDNSSFQIINFYKEEKNEMDAVFIGSSCVFSYYSPLFAYNAYGVKTTNFASSAMSLIAYKYAVEEVRKYQKDALIVITYTPQENMSYSYVHYMADYMPLSLNKLKFLNAYVHSEGDGVLGIVEWLLPIQTYHSRWNEIDADDFVINDGTKGATAHEYYLSLIQDVTNEYVESEERSEFDEIDLLNDLLDYLQDNEVNVLFLMPPRGYKPEEVSKTNTVYDIITQRGFNVLDMRNSFDEIGLIKTSDYYDKRHTNVHGSIKYTDYVIRHIQDNYDIRTNQEDKSFDNAFKKYWDKISPFVLDVELDMKNRDYSLHAPEVSITPSENSSLIKWDLIENAIGYSVYRYEDSWVKIADTKDTEFVDKEGNGNSNYVVIPYSQKGYGNYQYVGTRVG